KDHTVAALHPCTTRNRRRSRPPSYTTLWGTTPGYAVILNMYDDVRIEDAWNPDFFVQFRFRLDVDNEDSLAVHDVADRFYQRLDFKRAHQLSRLHLPGGVTVQWAERRITTDATPDDAGRWTRADSYRLTLNPS
ncbi:hypothetical protein, partial [Rhodococcus sp. NPDC006774]|uniref:hypothetical protein n=1 Tax=Rhodococcus sp. NPDC006774 TaxID=3157186 RepID=UPI0033CA8777